MGLIHALLARQGRMPSHEACAARACEVEIEQLKEPIGKQDQYAAAFGGMNYIRFNSDGTVQVEPIVFDAGTRAELESGCCCSTRASRGKPWKSWRSSGGTSC